MFGSRYRTAKGRYKEKKKLEDGQTLYVYGPRQVSNRHKEKAERLDGLQSKIPTLRKKVKGDLSNPVALVIALIDETAERVGNPTSAKEGHFGVTGWRKEHLKFEGGKAILTYVGKSGVKQKKTISSKPLVNALKKVSEGLKSKDELFPDVQSSHVNEYLKEFDISAKDLRGFHANDTMQSILKQKRKEGPELPRDRKEKDKILKKEFDKALKETAKQVGHEHTTLRSQYLVPGLEDDYLHDGSVNNRMKKTGSMGQPPTLKETDKYGNVIWEMEISQDSFIHFTYQSRVNSILSSNKLLMRPPHKKFGIDAVNAISTSWGKLVPNVQVNHLRGDHSKKDDPIVAIWFKTNVLPEISYIEEVIWKQDVIFTQAKKISFPKALQILSSNFDGVGDQDIVQYVRNSKLATLSQIEKEDRKSESQIKEDPKKKPPRRDLRDLNSTPHEKPSESKDLDRDSDKDLSRRSRHMAMKVATFFLQSKAAEEAEHKPGEVWQTDDKWRGMNPDGDSESFDEKDQAEQFAKGEDPDDGEEEGDGPFPGDVWQDEESGKWNGMDYEGKVQEFESEDEATSFAEGDDEVQKEEDSKEDPPEENKEPEEKGPPKKPSQPTDSDLNQAKQLIKSILEDDEVFDDDVQRSLKDAFKGLDEEQKKALSKALEDNLKDLSGKNVHTKAMAEMANKAIEYDGYEELTDPVELGKRLAQAIFARNVIANPMVLGGKKLSQSALSAKETSERAMEAYEHFQHLSPALKKSAAEKLDRYIQGLDEDHPHQNEANGMLSAIALSAIVKGEDPVPGRPAPSVGSAALIKKIAEQGNVDILLKPVEDYFEPQNQEVLKSAMKKMSTDELFDLLMRDFEDDEDDGKSKGKSKSKGHPYEGLKDLFDQDIPIPYPYSEGIRDFLINDYLSDHVWKDTAIRDSVKESGREEGAEERFKMLAEIKREAQSKLFDQYQECLQSAQQAAAEGKGIPKSTEDCLKDFEENKKAMMEAESAGQFLEALEKKGLTLPNTPAVAALKKLAETGDSTILSQRIKPNPGEFSGKKARLSFDKGNILHARLSLTHIRRQQMISKKAGQKIVATCDELADFFQKHASSFGIPPNVGLDMAKRLDTMSVVVEDHLSKQASNPTDTIDPTQNETETDVQSWEFNPTEIGQENEKAFMRDSDEPYMDVFKQDEFSQLRQVQQGGMFSNAKAASALILKMAKRLADAGIPIEVQAVKKK